MDTDFSATHANSRPAHSHSSSSSTRNFAETISAAIPWCVYLLCVGVLAAYEIQNAVPVPFGDDWAWVVQLVSNDPFNWNWLWAQHGEHRIPGPKLLLVSLTSISGMDFRMGCFLVAGMLALLAAALIFLARRIRGRLAWTDAVFPLVCLHFGHCENLLWSFQVQFAGSVLLSGLWLTLALRNPGEVRSMFQATALGTLGILLVGFGSNGVILAMCAALWLLAVGTRQVLHADARVRATGWNLLTGGVVTLLAVGLYFQGLNSLMTTPRPRTAWTYFSVGLQFLAEGLTPMVSRYWPFAGCVIPAGLLMTTLILLYVFWKQPAERSRSLALLASLGGLLGLAAAIAWGRAGSSETAGLSLRYATLAASSWFIMYYTFLLYVPAPRKSVLLGVLCLAAVVLYWPNYEVGQYWKNTRIAFLREFERDLQLDIPTGVLLQRFCDDSRHPLGQQISPQPEFAGKVILELRRRGAGAFRKTDVDGAAHMLDLDTLQFESSGLEWSPEKRSVKVVSDTASLRVLLPKPEFVQLLLATHLFPNRTKSNDSDSELEVAVIPADRSQQKSIETLPLPASPGKVRFILPVDQKVAGFTLTYRNLPGEFELPALGVLSGAGHKK